jgi:hypothetical protein
MELGRDGAAGGTVMAEAVPASEAPRASRLDRRKARTRQALIDAAVRLIAEGRGDRASIAEITEEADIGFGNQPPKDAGQRNPTYPGNETSVWPMAGRDRPEPGKKAPGDDGRQMLPDTLPMVASASPGLACGASASACAAAARGARIVSLSVRR